VLGLLQLAPAWKPLQESLRELLQGQQRAPPLQELLRELLQRLVRVLPRGLLQQALLLPGQVPCPLRGPA